MPAVHIKVSAHTPRRDDAAQALGLALTSAGLWFAIMIGGLVLWVATP